MQLKFLLFLSFFCVVSGIRAQETMTFNNISFPLGDSWSEAGNILLDPVSGEEETLDGTGVLLNMPDKRHKGADIYSNEKFGDFDISFYYLMFPGSNSGVYLHGNYEIQLLDSWGVNTPSFGDNGGVYQRWTEDETGYEGRPPLQNASRAPGVWQHMIISFTAPRFDGSGNKVANARVSVTLNGVVVQEDVELTGPTRGAAGEEVASGPVRIQGDHGPVAFRDMEVIAFDNETPELSSLTYSAYEGLYNDMPDYTSLSPVSSGEVDKITAEVSPSGNEFLLHFSGTLTVHETGVYKTTAGFAGGNGMVKIDGNEVIPFTGWGAEETVQLTEGSHTFEFSYAKLYEWVSNGISFRIEGPGIRETELADARMNMGNVTDPIYLDGPNVLRSFMDIPDEGRVVRAISVGSSHKVHYTYDLANGALVHAWRGEFLDTTPMWHDRGDGSSRPRGSVCYLDGRIPAVQPMSAQWQSDTTGMDFAISGYRENGDGGATFAYSLGSNQIEDRINVLPTGKGLSRTITANGNSSLYLRLGHGEEVSEIDKGMFRVAGKGNYFIQLDQSVDTEIRLTPDGEMELIAPVGSSITYSILF